jgi:hypothetical protein
MIQNGICPPTAYNIPNDNKECGIKLRPSDMIDLTNLTCQEAMKAGHLPCAGIAPSPGGCDEFLRYLYVERKVDSKELEKMRGRMTGLRDHGEYITLRIVPMEDVWKISGDNKAIWYVVLWMSLDFLSILRAHHSDSTYQLSHNHRN